ncbi:histidine kinase [Nocardia sp. CDC159]|uniref:histidine kinase n=1 Tax=Nocardia pulmonis TaxID=2951408 RepID=A0A9X2E1J4_9NOCA|nr:MULTISPECIES: histidine kinase [Nocardia]MCM6772484.1 histidine kinase [Nocardia pulmonis]MCM6784858.1 histidine kinase [Nocardia sp. CDC159]
MRENRLGVWARRRARASLRGFAAVGGEPGTVRRSLARQSVLVAVAAAVVDILVFTMSGIYADAPALAVLLSVAIVAADLALAAPPSTAAVVAAAQVAVRLVQCWLLHRHGLPLRVADVGFLVAGYRAGAWLSPRASLVTVPLLGLGASTASLLSGSPAAHDWRLLATQAVSAGLVPWLVGRYTAARGAYIAELEQRERLRQQEHRAALDRALTDEREAIARDLHDVISHHVAAIGIHAGAARLALPSGDTRAAESLTAVEASSRAAMNDLRRQLDLLHGRDDAGRRQPGLADIEELVDTVRAAGLDITVELDAAPDAPPLPESLDVIVFRIVQELLTNALRHGDGTAALRVRRDGRRLRIDQTNPLAAQPDPGTGVRRGLDGIRRRAELFGGAVEHGAAADRWHITVTLPIGAS